VAGRQGAFDAIHLVSDTHIRFVQVGKTHSFYLDIIHLLVLTLLDHNITWPHLKFMLLRPESERQISFSLKTARGAIQNYKRFDDVLWDRRDYRNNVQYAFLSWN
jgi:hypothetical protein